MNNLSRTLSLRRAEFLDPDTRDRIGTIFFLAHYPSKIIIIILNVLSISRAFHMVPASCIGRWPSREFIERWFASRTWQRTRGGTPTPMVEMVRENGTACKVTCELALPRQHVHRVSCAQEVWAVLESRGAGKYLQRRDIPRLHLMVNALLR